VSARMLRGNWSSGIQLNCTRPCRKPLPTGDAPHRCTRPTDRRAAASASAAASDNPSKHRTRRARGARVRARENWRAELGRSPRRGPRDRLNNHDIGRSHRRSWKLDRPPRWRWNWRVRRRTGPCRAVHGRPITRRRRPGAANSTRGTGPGARSRVWIDSPTVGH